MKTVSFLLLAGIALTGCQQTPAPASAPGLSANEDSLAVLNDAAHLCQQELQGSIAFKEAEGKIRLYCRFSDSNGQSREADAVRMLKDFAQGMVKGDSIGNH